MTIYSGNDGQVLYEGTAIAKVSSWSLQVFRDIEDVTCSGAWRNRVLPLKRSATGSVSFYYDPTDTQAQAWLGKLDEDGAAPVELELVMGLKDNNSFLLQEDGSFLLTETGNKIVLEGVGGISTLLLEDGGQLLQEDGSVILLEESDVPGFDTLCGHRVQALLTSAPVTVSVGSATAGVFNFRVTGPILPL